MRPFLRALLCLFLLPAVAAALDVPPLQGRVNDYGNMIPADTRQRIEQKLADFEQRTTNQIAVLTVDSLEGDPIEDFSLRVAEAWKLGQAEKDNGVLFVVSKQDRRMRTEVGYGLEPVLTDLETNIIQREVVVPAFRSGDFGGGIEAGVDAMIAAIQGEEVEPAAEQQPLGGGRGQGLPSFLFFALIFLVPFSLSAARSGSWLVGLFLTPFYFFLGSMVNPLLGIIAAGVWIVVFSVLRLLFPGRLGSRSRRGGGWWIGPGFGGGGGGWSGGGGGGFGGFSGGGGSFGGGGSSSSW